MPIPVIAPYRLPTEADLPADQTAWQLDAHRAMLLVHDMQQYFVDFFPVGQAPRDELTRNIAALCRTAREQGVPVAYSAQPGGMSPEQRGLLHDFWGPGMDASPKRRRIVPELAPAPGDIMLTKWRYSAFVRTGLHEIMTRLGRDQLIVCGVYAHVGCLITACDAFSRDIQPFVVADAMADFSLQDHLMALKWAASRCAVTLTTGGTLAGLLGRQQRQPVR